MARTIVMAGCLSGQKEGDMVISRDLVVKSDDRDWRLLMTRLHKKADKHKLVLAGSSDGLGNSRIQWFPADE